MNTTYAIVNEKVLAMCAQQQGEHVELTRGMMVEVRGTSDRYATIMILDYYQKNLAFEHNLYLCKSSALFQVPLHIWSFLIAIFDPITRTNTAKDKALVDYILSLDIDSFVTVNGQLFNFSPINQSLSFLPEREPKERSFDYECIIRFAGEVDELGPGTVFGLELLVNFLYSTQNLISAFNF